MTAAATDAVSELLRWPTGDFAPRRAYEPRRRRRRPSQRHPRHRSRPTRSRLGVARGGPAVARRRPRAVAGRPRRGRRPHARTSGRCSRWSTDDARVGRSSRSPVAVSSRWSPRWPSWSGAAAPSSGAPRTRWPSSSPRSPCWLRWSPGSRWPPLPEPPVPVEAQGPTMDEWAAGGTAPVAEGAVANHGADEDDTGDDGPAEEGTPASPSAPRRRRIALTSSTRHGHGLRTDDLGSSDVEHTGSEPVDPVVADLDLELGRHPTSADPALCRASTPTSLTARQTMTTRTRRRGASLAPARGGPRPRRRRTPPCRALPARPAARAPGDHVPDRRQARPAWRQLGAVAASGSAAIADRPAVLSPHRTGSRVSTAASS